MAEKSSGYLEDLLSQNEVNYDEWQAKIDERQSGSEKKTAKFIPSFWLEDGKMGLVNFLNEGIQLQLYQVKNRDGHFSSLIWFPDNPLERASSKKHTFKPSDRAVYAVVDWLHQYESKNNGVVKQPTVKIFSTGYSTASIINGRRGDKRQGDGTLLGRQWEITRRGKSTSTVYDPMAGDEKLPDFEEMKTIETGNGPLEVPIIRSYDWPEYDESLPFEDQSVYTQKQMRPTVPMDWNNPELVNRWLKLHFLNVPIGEYREIAGGVGSLPSQKPDQRSGQPKTW